MRMKELFVLLVASSFIACTPQHDIVIRGATLFDGTGSAGVVGDLAIDGDRIAAMGDVRGRGELEIDAEGLYVAPGSPTCIATRR